MQKIGRAKKNTIRLSSLALVRSKRRDFAKRSPSKTASIMGPTPIKTICIPIIYLTPTLVTKSVSNTKIFSIEVAHSFCLPSDYPSDLAVRHKQAQMFRLAPLQNLRFVKVMGSPDFSFEQVAQQRGLSLVAGVDEVGRGPLAGPVTAAAVILDAAHLPLGLDDSKKLSAMRRTELAVDIRRFAEVSVAHASVEEIDAFNILRASHLAMQRAVAGLVLRPDHVLVDGNIIPSDMKLSAEAVVKGDRRSLSIAAASIVAKVERDQIMIDLAANFPGYGWEKNAGYPSRLHKLALESLGVTPHHRCSFKPVHNILYPKNY